MAVASFVSIALVSALASAPSADPRAGVSLDDLVRWAPDSPEGARLVIADDFVRRYGVSDWGTVISVSLVASTPREMTIDVVARNPRYSNHGPMHRHGGVGITRVALDLAADDGCPSVAAARTWSALVDLVGKERWPSLQAFVGALPGTAAPCAVRDWRIVHEKQTRDLAFTIRVSLGDILAVVEVAELDFRRVFPLGIGAVDRIRLPGQTTSITATTETAIIKRETSWLEMTQPKHFKGKPYMPLQVPRRRIARDGSETRTWHGSWIAFHIWQAKGFDREYASHGCMRMRDEDLDELAAYLWGIEGGIPVVIRPAPLPDVTHPWPRQGAHFWRLQNFGSEAAPKHRIINNTWVTQFVAAAVPGSFWESVPGRDGLVGITIDLKPYDARISR